MHNSHLPFDIEDAIDGVLVPSIILKARDKSRRIVEQAQMNAVKIVKLANHDAEKITEAAYCQGYQAGIMMAFNSIADYLKDSDALYHQFYDSVNESIRQNLENVLGGEKVFGLLIEEWLQKLAQENKESNHPLILLIPQHSPNIKHDLLLFIKTIWTGEIQLNQHDENRYVIKHANRIAEFSPAQWISQQKIHVKYSSLLEQQLEKLSESALEDMVNAFTGKLVNKQFNSSL